MKPNDIYNLGLLKLVTLNMMSMEEAVAQLRWSSIKKTSERNQTKYLRKLVQMLTDIEKTNPNLLTNLFLQSCQLKNLPVKDIHETTY